MDLRKLLGLAAVVVPAFVAGCSQEVADDDTGAESALSVEEGPVDTAGSSTEVWSVTHKWTDRAPSGKTYEEDYVDWVAGLRRTNGFKYGQTLMFTTPAGSPYQKELAAPTLECADTALFARVVYAALNHLPFYVKSDDLYAGHFGFIKKDGTPHPWGSNFKSYKDYEGTWRDGDPWPSDSRLRGMHISSYKSGDETFVESNPGTKGGGGAWFDEFLLNKRVGYFILKLVDMFGSINLASERNLFHIKADATQPGDALLHRHGKYAAIGHTLFVYQVRKPRAGRLEIEVVSGSMPARQASWEPHYQSRGYFLNHHAGGEETVQECRPEYSLDYQDKTKCKKEVGTTTRASGAECPAGYDKHSWDETKCVKYSVIPSENTDIRKMGGGIRRFRTPVLQSGRWMNIVPRTAASVYIPDTDVQAIGDRVKQFEELLSLGTPEERKTAALATIESYREYIRNAPSTCSKRTAREDAFADLYRAYSDMGTWDKAKVDKDHRTLEDYVFAELDYDLSKTCCWNSTKREHYDTIMKWADAEMKKADANQTCIAPPVFKAEGAGDGYEKVRAFAKSKNLPFPDAWTEDETCKAKTVQEDTVTARGTEAKYCR